MPLNDTKGMGVWNIYEKIEQKSCRVCFVFQHKTLHKEELTMSEKEKGVRKKIQTHAPQVQQKKTLEIQAQKTKVSESAETAKSEKEKGVRKKIQTHAPQVQQNKTLEIQAQKTKVSE